MRNNFLKAILKTSVRGATVLLLGAGVASAQPQQVNLTAAATATTLPDGSSVPMWGYSCDATQPMGTTAACAALNKSAAGGWSPVIITVPSGQDLQINLTNNLPVPPTATTGIPTSLMIVGQMGGGAGSPGGTTPAPDHSLAQTTTWPIADPGTTGTPPTQGPRVQSFGTEVATGATTSLTWTKPRPGTYLLESGTHPSIQGPMGLIGMVVVTTAPVPGPSALTSKPGIAYTGVNYNADVPVLLSEIDPVQNRAVNKAVGTAGFSESATFNPSLATGGQLQPAMAQCGGGAAACYPPVVNYTPLYYLVNGTAFNKTNPNGSLIPASPVAGVVPGTGSVLVRMVNAGSRMHVPSIVGSVTGTATAPATPPAGFSLIAEDGNPLPGVPRVQSEVFLAAGKTYDVMINAPAAGGKALPVYDRELSLSANASVRDAGMFAYISVNGAGVPSSPSLGGSVVAADDNYTALIAGNKLTVSDPLKGVIANDTNVFGATLLQPPANGTVTLNDNGTFTYVPTTFTCTGQGRQPFATRSPIARMEALRAEYVPQAKQRR